MIKLKSAEEIKIMREGGKILAAILADLSVEVKTGVKISSIDDLANKLCKKHKVIPVFLNYQPEWMDKPFPGSLCISIDDEVVHGIPNRGDEIFKEGQVVALDMGI